MAIAGILAIVVLLASGAVIWTVRRSFPTTDGSLTLDVLDARVDVYRDAWGVPQLYGQSMEDLARAQGFVHAQDRFWEMDVRRHTTAGRLSELFGASQVDTDTFLRTLGWHRVARQELELLTPQTRAVFEAYAEGVNAYLDRHDSTSKLSLEYAVLGLQHPGYQPEPWTAVDSLAWQKAMAWDLRSNMEAEIDRGLLSGALPAERIEELYPPYPYDRHGTIVAGGEVVGGSWVPASGQRSTAVEVPSPMAPEGADTAATTAARSHLAELDTILAAVPAMLGKSGPGIGSNSWVLAGEHTASGMPLLANDPHLGPAVPSIWYQMGLHCTAAGCPLDVVGFGFAGVPGVVVGHNKRIAWGVTNLAPDVTDLYVERLDGDRYFVDGQWRPLDVRTETIEVAGGEPVEITVRATRHGPLLSDRSEQLRDVLDDGSLPTVERNVGAEDYGLALRWTALDPGRTADAIVGLNVARNFEEFRGAARMFEVPAQNLVYADVDGHIGYQAPGRIPIRAPGHSGRWPVPGWTTANDWQGFVPFDELPWELDPEDGLIVTANEAAIAPGFTHFLTDDWAYGYRGARIRELLGSLDDATIDDLLAVQLDTYNLNADALVPALLAVAAPDADVRESQALLADWNHHQDRESAGGALFEAVWRHLLRRTFHDELPASTRPSGGSRWFEVVRGLLEQPRSAWWDDIGTERVETRDDVLGAALTDAVDELSRRFGSEPDAWRWGELHTLTLTHATLGTSGIGVIEGLFNRGPYETAGGKSIVNATGWTAPDGYEVDWVPSMRMLVDLGDLDASRWVNLTGASGHAYHPHYVDQTPRWQSGTTLPMRTRRTTVEEEARTRLRLEPSS